MQFQNGIRCKETKTFRHPEVIDPVVNVISVIEVEKNLLNQSTMNKPSPKIGKIKQKVRSPSEKTVSYCSHK